MAYYDRKNKESVGNVIEMLKKVKAGRARRRRAAGDMQRNPERAEEIKKQFEQDLESLQRARMDALGENPVDLRDQLDALSTNGNADSNN